MENTEQELAWWKRRQDMKAFFKRKDEIWQTSALAMKFYVAGAMIVVLGLVSILVTIVFDGAKNFPQCMVTVGVGSIALGLLIEAYQLVMALLATTLGKVAAGFFLTLAIALANGMAQVVINSATGLDPTYFSGTRAFVTPLMVIYFFLLGSIALFFITTMATIPAMLFDMVKHGLAKRHSMDEQNQQSKMYGHIARFIAAICLLGVSQSGWQLIQEPYEDFLDTTAVRFTYHLEMYPDIECFADKTIHTKRISDQLVLTGKLKNGLYTFRAQSCDIASHSGT